jgi:hypothetical protein
VEVQVYSWYPLNRKLVGPQRWSETFGEGESSTELGVTSYLLVVGTDLRRLGDKNKHIMHTPPSVVCPFQRHLYKLQCCVFLLNTRANGLSKKSAKN